MVLDRVQYRLIIERTITDKITYYTVWRGISRGIGSTPTSLHTTS
jgi:hypothetical protein